MPILVTLSALFVDLVVRLLDIQRNLLARKERGYG